MNRVFPAIAIVSVMFGVIPPALSQVTITQRSIVVIMPGATDQNGASMTVTGMSGVTFRSGFASNAEFLAVMDNSDKLVRLCPTFAPDGSISRASVLGGITLSLNGDHEGIAFTNSASNSVFVSDEVGPAIDEFDLATGSFIRTLAVPSVFTAAGNLRPNFGFESLSRRPDNGEMWTANEEALTIDGESSSPSAGTPVRLTCYSGDANPAPQQQHVYVTEPMHGVSISGSRSGVSDLVALPGGRLLVLERSFAFAGAGLFKNSIYLVDTAEGNPTNVASLTGGLIGQAYTPLVKHLIWSTYLNQNLEGLCLGPRLSPTSHVLLGVIDDADPVSTNVIISFQLNDPDECIADFDGSVAPTIDDIFIYLNAWFASDPRADVDGLNAVSIDDIFTFLNRWFAGC